MHDTDMYINRDRSSNDLGRTKMNMYDESMQTFSREYSDRSGEREREREDENDIQAHRDAKQYELVMQQLSVIHVEHLVFQL
jgi:hypothetical protein